MKICLLGLWHLGSVISACIASKGHHVIGVDNNQNIIKNLNDGKAPLFEPKLNELIKKGLDSDNLKFADKKNIKEELLNVEILWVAIDTPVDENDKADINYVEEQVIDILPYLKKNIIILFSSQMPVGSIKKMETFVLRNFPEKKFSFACSPENLRLGTAIEVFLNPDRIIVGVNNKSSQEKLNTLFKSITNKIEWMSIESAEMTKHAINTFLANSITFANEIATICEQVGADAQEVELGLKTDSRIGQKAYLSPGDPIAGGTLVRDVNFLDNESKKYNLYTPLISAIVPSNNEHKNWIRRKLLEQFNSLSGVSITIWGLTYKPDTDSLRRSLSVELCDWLIAEGAKISVYDPVITKLPKHWDNNVEHFTNALDTLKDSAVLVIGTKWPEFNIITNKIISIAKKDLIVIDPNHHLDSQILKSKLKYITMAVR